MEEKGLIIRYDYVRRENLDAHEIITLGRRTDVTTGEVELYPLKV